MTSYFSLPVVPTVLGYDARLQFVHEDDGIEALRMSIDSEVTGVFNVAGEGVLAVSQAIRRSGRPALAVPRPLLGVAGRSLGRAGLADFSPEQVRFLTYGRGIDTARARTVLGFTPKFGTPAAFDDFLAGRAETRELLHA